MNAEMVYFSLKQTAGKYYLCHFYLFFNGNHYINNNLKGTFNLIILEYGNHLPYFLVFMLNHYKPSRSIK